MKRRRARHEREQLLAEFILLRDRQKIDALRQEQHMRAAQRLSLKLKEKELQNALAFEAAASNSRMASRNLNVRVNSEKTSTSFLDVRPAVRVEYKEYGSVALPRWRALATC